jgi:hypothetical protein
MSEVSEVVDRELADFNSRLHNERQRLETIAGWHMRAYQEGGCELPWSVDSTWNNVNVSKYYPPTKVENADGTVTETKGKYVDDVEASRDKLAKLAKFATKQPGVLVTKNYDDKDFELKVVIPSLDETTSFEITYYVKREAVCTKKVIGTKEVPEQVIPARTEEIVEWDCEPISLLKIAEHKK